MKAKVSIVITCYREGELLLKCWNSVLAQSSCDWDAIMVLDGGYDECTEKIFNYITHPRLTKHINATNMGAFPTRNSAFDYARGEILFYLDADDCLPLNAVKTVIKTSEKNKNKSFFYGDIHVFGLKDYKLLLPHNYGKQKLLETLIHQGGWAYRRSIWEKLGPFKIIANNPNGPSDLDFHLTLYENNFRGVHCGETLYELRKNDRTTMSNSYNESKHIPAEAIVKNHPLFFDNNRLITIYLGRVLSIAAEANAKNGDRTKARRLALRAIRLSRFKYPINLFILLTGRHPGKLYTCFRNLINK